MATGEPPIGQTTYIPVPQPACPGHYGCCQCHECRIRRLEEEVQRLKSQPPMPVYPTYPLSPNPWWWPQTWCWDAHPLGAFAVSKVDVTSNSNQ